MIVWLDVDERWPDYRLGDGIAVDVPIEQAERWTRVLTEYAQVQAEIGAAARASGAEW